MNETDNVSGNLKRPLLDRNYFDVSVREVEDLLREVLEVYGQLKVDNSTRRVNDSQREQIEGLKKKVQVALKQAREYSKQTESDFKVEYDTLEDKVTNVFEDVEEKTLKLEREWSKGTAEDRKKLEKPEESPWKNEGVTRGEAIKMDLEINDREDRIKHINAKARAIKSIANDVNTNIYESDSKLDEILKINRVAADNTSAGNEQLMQTRERRVKYKRMLYASALAICSILVICLLLWLMD